MKLVELLADNFSASPVCSNGETSLPWTTNNEGYSSRKSKRSVSPSIKKLVSVNSARSIQKDK